jgi:very-long-chain (3R)-3-hydroxyacyl-CoA dehydratase
MSNSIPATAQKPTSTVSARKVYLTTYNLIFAALWTSVFVKAISNASSSKPRLFSATEAPARWIQTASLIEVVHSATGLIKSPVSTTALQVVTRVIQVWMVWYSFPSSTADSHAYLALLLAWSVADTIRYAYLAANLWGKAGRGLVWLRYVPSRQSRQIPSLTVYARYTMFYPLYPIGIGAEWWLLYRAIEPAGKINAALSPFFWFCLMLYIPGKLILATKGSQKLTWWYRLVQNVHVYD